MSRIGKLPIAIDKDVQVNVAPDNTVSLKKGNTTQSIKVDMSIKVSVDNNEIVLTRKNDERQTRAYHGLYRSLIHNSMVGVVKGWAKELELNGVGYRAAVKGKILELNLGFSHQINHKIPDGIAIKVDKNTKITVAGASRELVGQVAAEIRDYRPPEPYLGKGVRYSDEHIRRKVGKSASK